MTEQVTQRPASSELSARHLLALDGVRGLAILLVVLRHVAEYAPAPAEHWGRLLYDTMSSGWIGVDVFFVLSGFLITGILLDARGDASRPPARYFTSFYARRVLRIFPLYYAFVAIAVVVTQTTPAAHGTWWYWVFLPNVLLARYGWSSAMPGTSHLWSLAVEEQFYIVWPALVAWLARGWVRGVCILLIIGAPLLRLWMLGHGQVVGAYVLTLARADTLAFGASVAILVRSAGRHTRLARGLAAAGLAGLIALLVLDRIAQPDHRLSLIAGTECIALLTAAGIYLAVVDGGPRWLSNPVLRSFGRYSYAMYLIHVPMCRTGVTWVARHVSGSLPMLGVDAVAVLALSWGVAWILWRVVERPVLSLKRFVPMPSPRMPNPEYGV